MRYFHGFAVALCAFAAASCVAEEGTMPGNDPTAAVTIFSYAPELPYNPDNDISLRFATNEQTSDAYYLAEHTADKAARVASVGEDGYMDYVIANGQHLAGIRGESVADVILTDLMGDYTITAVAVGSCGRSATSVAFTGLEWEDVVSGTYYYGAASFTADFDPSETVLQKCTSDETLYRFKDVFAPGYSLKINILPGYSATDADGTYRYFRVSPQNTPFTYGSYGQVYIRDIGYWQGSDAWVTENGYESGMYEDGYCFVSVQYYVSAGSLGYGYDEFVPNE